MLLPIDIVREENFFSSRFFGWSNNKINIKQLNKIKTKLITYIWGLHKNMRNQDNQTIEAFMLFWTNKKGLGIWNFKGEEDSTQGAGKSKCMVEKVCHAPKDKGQREDFGL